MSSPETTQPYPFSRTVFILNPRSGVIGNKRNLIRLIDRVWGATSHRYSILVTTRAGEGVRLTQEEASRGADLVVAVGGDGTLNEIVRGALQHPVTVGLIPAGSGNGFARHWNISLHLETVCRGLLRPRIVPCDVGMADDHPFVVTFGCGIDAAISERYARSNLRGMVSYFYHGIRTFASYQSRETRVHLNGEIAYSGRPMLLTLANARGFGGGTVIAPDARVDDGVLDLIAVDAMPMRTVLRHLGDLFNGGIQNVPGYLHAQVREAVIERDHDGAIHVDGDPLPGNRRIRIRILPSALRMALPT